jgi:hypothetical protein
MVRFWNEPIRPKTKRSDFCGKISLIFPNKIRDFAKKSKKNSKRG